MNTRHDETNKECEKSLCESVLPHPHEGACGDCTCPQKHEEGCPAAKTHRCLSTAPTCHHCTCRTTEQKMDDFMPETKKLIAYNAGYKDGYHDGINGIIRNV